MTPWFLAEVLGNEGGGNFSSSYLILTFLIIIKYNPLIVETQTRGLRESRPVASDFI